MSPDQIKTTIARALEEMLSSKKEVINEDDIFQWIKNSLLPKVIKSNFSTHISKGIHSSSNGENVTFKPDMPLPTGYVGSQSVAKLDLDLSGNASNFPVAKFFSIKIDESHSLGDLILDNDPALAGVFAKSLEKSEEYRIIFNKVLKGTSLKGITDERNKQVLWCNNQDAILDDDYTCLIPLHPVSLLKETHYKVVSRTRSPNMSIPSLARVAFGGQHPENVSFFTNNQAGVNYLLPSFPPIYHRSSDFKLKLTDRTIFNKRLAHVCRFGFRKLFESTEIRNRNFHRKTKIFDAVNTILQIVLSHVCFLQEQNVGWSKAYSLAWEEKYWLDPKRAELEGETDFKEGYEIGEWREIIEHKFTLWIRYFLQKYFPSLNEDFKDTDYQELRTKVTQLLRYRLRLV
ncbi:type I-F CRISPR-associated protein Csy1 [Pasteurella multocida]|uniref:type I-F CRISPR-associated protein Csy1 n=1 Tax=Pasteurella multocida TaxID=747 RepID=UPI0035F474A7